jgi:hypothetical protein
VAKLTAVKNIKTGDLENLCFLAAPAAPSGTNDVNIQNHCTFLVPLKVPLRD